LFVDPTLGMMADKKSIVLLQIIGGGRWIAQGQAGGGATVPGAIMAFTLGGAGGGGTTATATSVVAMQSNLPLNYISYAAVTFAIVVTIVNVVINGRNRKKAM
jgi:hypothetical protein